MNSFDALEDLKVTLNFLAEDLLGEYSDDSLKSLTIEVSKEIANHIFKAAKEEGPTPRQVIERTIKEILVKMTRA